MSRDHRPSSDSPRARASAAPHAAKRLKLVPPDPIDLTDSSPCGPRLDRSQADVWAKCASVQLRAHKPRGHVTLAIKLPAPQKPTRRRVTCHPITQAMRNTYRNGATETVGDGACSIAVHVAVAQLGIHFETRAIEGDGFDFFFRDRALAASDYDLFVGTAVIEVSGIDRETPSNSIAARARQKAAQARSRHDFRVAYAIIVEFATPQALVVSA